MELSCKYHTDSPVRHTVEIEVPWEEVEKLIPKAVDWFRENVRIDGFRKGKATAGAVKAKVGQKAILDRASELAMSEAFGQVTKELEKKPIAPPDYKPGDVVKGEPFTFTVSYFVEPPDPVEIGKEIHERDAAGTGPGTDNAFPDGTHNMIGTVSGHSVDPEVIRNNPTLSAGLGSGIASNPAPSIPEIPGRKPVDPVIPDPNEFVKPLDVKPDGIMPKGIPGMGTDKGGVANDPEIE